MVLNEAHSVKAQSRIEGHAMCHSELSVFPASCVMSVKGLTHTELQLSWACVLGTEMVQGGVMVYQCELLVM